MLDPAVLPVHAESAEPAGPDVVPLAPLAPWLTIVADAQGGEHAVICDGRHRLQLDIVSGSLADCEAVTLDYCLRGVCSAEPRLLTLRRLLGLVRHRRFVRSLFPRDPGVPRQILLLRVGDALATGASQRDIAAALFGDDAVSRDWNGRSDALRSRVRRLVRDAKAMAAGGYRQLLRRGGR